MEKKATVDVDPKTAEMISAVAKKTGMDESSVVAKLMSLQLADKPADPMREKLQRMREAIGGGNGSGKGMMERFMDMESIKMMRGDSGDSKEKEDDSLIDKKTIKMMFQMQMLQQMLPQSQPQQPQGNSMKETLEIFALMNSATDGKGGADSLEKLMEYQRHQDELRRRDDEKRSQEMLTMMEKAITGKRIDEIEEKVEQREDKLREDQQRQLEYLQSMEARLAAGQPQSGGFSDEMRNYTATRTALLDFAKGEGMTKEVIDPSGKIKWESILQEGIGALRDIGTAHAQQAPQQQDVIEMSPEEYAAYQAGQQPPQEQTPVDTPSEFAVEEPILEQPPEPPVETQEIQFSPTGTVVDEPKKKGKKK